jgi:hypothetical protein
MTAIEQAEQLRLQAIEILTAERGRIDEQLAQLGHGQEKAPTGKRRGRKPKNFVEQEVLELVASHS